TRLVPRGSPPLRAVRDRLAPHIPARSTVAVARANHPGRFVALMVGEDGSASRIAKVAIDPRGEEALEREADSIERLGSLLSAPLRPPTLVNREPRLLLFEAERWRPRLRPWRLRLHVPAAVGRLPGAGSEAGRASAP